MHFDDMCEVVVQMFNHLLNVPNRSVLYDLYNYICDIKRGVRLARAYVKTLGVKMYAAEDAAAVCPQHAPNIPACK